MLFRARCAFMVGGRADRLTICFAAELLLRRTATQSYHNRGFSLLSNRSLLLFYCFRSVEADQLAVAAYVRFKHHAYRSAKSKLFRLCQHRQVSFLEYIWFHFLRKFSAVVTDQCPCALIAGSSGRLRSPSFCDVSAWYVFASSPCDACSIIYFCISS